MPSEEYIAKLASRFAKREDAFTRLDSMGYVGEQIGLTDSIVREHLNQAADIAKAYPLSQIDALTIVEQLYGKASKEPRSYLSRFSHGLTNDPMPKICRAVIARNPKPGDLDHLRSLVRNILVGAEEGEFAHKPVPFKPYAFAEQPRKTRVDSI